MDISSAIHPHCPLPPPQRPLPLSLLHRQEESCFTDAALGGVLLSNLPGARSYFLELPDSSFKPSLRICEMAEYALPASP